MKVLVKTGWGIGSLTEYRHIWSTIEPDHVADDLPAAVGWILGERTGLRFPRYPDGIARISGELGL